VLERCASDLVEGARPIGPSDRMLDLGCGSGIVARVLRQRLGGAADIVGVDASEPLLEMARAVAPDIEFVHGDFIALPFADDSFDLVLSQQLLQLAADSAGALGEVRRVLSPGGRLVTNLWRSSGQEADLENALTRAGFHEVRIHTVSFDDACDGRLVVNVSTATTPRK
jgi:ubiquinone/menaquinone biosynthesis C-methylase UbiE